MDDQTTLYARPPEKSCESCLYYSGLKDPRPVEHGEATIYGYCFKSGTNSYSTNMGKGHPVYISGGSCKHYQKHRAEEK